MKEGITDLKSDMLASMSDEKMIDCHLIGTDGGVGIPCSKFVLATRSEVFKNMFYSGFLEQHADRAPIAYPSKIIQIIVMYCYSDQVNLDSIPDDKGLTDQQVTLLVQLRDAARFFGLGKIQQSVEEQVAEFVFRNKIGAEHVCSFLEEIMAPGEEDGPFWEILFQFVLMKPEECLHLDHGVMKCHPRLLARLLEKITDTSIVARCLYAWSAQESKEEASASTDQEKEMLLAVARRIDLKQLSTKELSSIGHCLAFSKDRMLEAYEHHGRISQPQPFQPFRTPTFSSPKATVYVAGAGVAGLNGLYMQCKNDKQRFVKDGIYGGLRSEFEIKYHSADNKWCISVLPKTETSCPLQMYQAFEKPAGDKSHEIKIPFNHWVGLEGAKPAPYTAIIQPPNHFQPPLSTWGTVSFSTGVSSTAPDPQPQQRPPFPPLRRRGTRRFR
ncbi:unnamed protein product [Cylindrotheca closterium]|uniref:BTB domain-containing protein n=1 Tax=Cylindrotheca closterium TaxID=2856 RepID=A0AAD2FU91_9STRA|nr:unnamed protein product [Cylindrotheca closterium]